jgi:hypothetical protein
MLIPLTRQKFEVLVPLIATGAQYVYCWGKLPDLLRRLLFSVVGVVLVLWLGSFLGESGGLLRFILGITTGFYWLWGPVLWASLKNAECRKFQYSGFWQGRVLDMYVTEELIGKEETVNKRGELVIVENRERRLNLQVGDESGFMEKIQVPLKRNHQAIAPGDIAQMVVMSYRGDLGKIAKTTDIYILTHDLWVSDYPFLQRDVFVDVSRQLRSRTRDKFGDEPRIKRNSRNRSQPRRKPSNAEMEDYWT